jgi:hypothetical protein
VKADESSSIWRIDGETFLAALTETTLSPSFVSGMSMRLARTHPNKTVNLPNATPASELDQSH